MNAAIEGKKIQWYGFPGMVKPTDKIKHRTVRSHFAVIEKKLREERLQMEKDRQFFNCLKIFYKVSEETGISVQKIRGKSRKRDIVWARHLFFFMAYKFTSYPLTDIQMVISVHHASFIHGRDSIQSFREAYGKVACKQDKIRQINRLQLVCWKIGGKKLYRKIGK